MRENQGPWEFLARLHRRRAQSMKEEWQRAQRERQELIAQRDAASQRMESMHQHSLAVAEKIESQKSAKQLNIPQLLSAQRYFEDVKRQLVALTKELTRCQAAVDQHEGKLRELWQRIQLHEQKSTIYQDRQQRFLRYQENCIEEINDEEANEGLIARAYMTHQTQGRYHQS